MGNVNVCARFGYDVEGGMKAFSIVEMFLAFYHIIAALYTYKHFVYPLYDKTGKEFTLTMIMIFHIIFMVALFVQAVFGVLLFFLGYKKRNITICFIWMITACVNFTLPWVILIFSAMEWYSEKHKGMRDYVKNKYEGTLEEGLPWYYRSWYLYLLYLIMGVWIVVGYMKWAKRTGVAVQFSVRNVPPTASTANSSQQKASTTQQQEKRDSESNA